MDRGTAIIFGAGRSWSVRTATGVMNGYGSIYWAAVACDTMGLVWTVDEGDGD